ncbi:MFS general substrate transporter [Setomelanomma holmii]|uniref:MFS general substrate transporter n=1 Tax=Setomelanomma holmii TaxID=210430 RepID=A0A9P4HES7_9PLEO|nr:MFS general substrate transporter [Setomelanomma holmii]
MFKSVGFSDSSPPTGLKWRSNTYFIVFTVGMGAFTDLFLYGLIVPVLPYMLKDRVNLPDSQIQNTVSNLLAIYAGASFAASPIAGILADKFSNSRKLPFVLGLVMLVFATVLLAVGQSVAIFAVARFLQGASGGVVWTIGLAIVIETVGQENLGKTMGTVFSFVSVAGLFSPILGGLMYASVGYKGVFGLGIGLVGVDFILRLLMVEKKAAAKYDEAQPATDGTSDETEQTPLLPQTTKAHARYRLSKPGNRITRALPILLLLRDPGLLTAIWISFMQAFLLGAFDATVPLVSSEQFGFNSLKAGLLFIPLGGADFFFGPVFGWGVDRYGTRLFSLDNARHIALYAGLLAANGIGLAVINSPSIVEAGNIVEKYYQANEDVFEQAPYAQLYGISSMVFSGGLTVGPLLAGHLRERIGYGNMNAVLAGICAFTSILVACFMGRKEENLSEDDNPQN